MLTMPSPMPILMHWPSARVELEEIIEAWDAHNLDHALDVAADALRLPPWDADVTSLSGGERRRVALCRLLLSTPGYAVAR